MSVVASFEIAHSGCLGPDGEVVGKLPDFAADPAVLIANYRAMVLARIFDHKGTALQRVGRLGTFASALGEEAVAVGVAAAMEDDDVLVPSFREHGAQLWRGVTLEELFLFWGGDERGNDFAVARHDFPNAVPVASHAPHAAGAALAFKLRNERRAAVCLLGDGATSKGDFYEAMNAAGVWRLPLLLVIVNNQWAISVPRREQSAAGTLAQKAIAAGIPGEQVDGNDVIAMHAASLRALARAHAGDGPTVIEALTYRLADHTTADDATRYRDPDDVSRHWTHDPIARLRTYLATIGAWDKEHEHALEDECRQLVEDAAAAWLATPALAPEAMFDHLFETLPAVLAAQRAAVVADTADD